MAILLGFVECLTKPFSSEGLREIILKWFIIPNTVPCTMELKGSIKVYKEEPYTGCGSHFWLLAICVTRVSFSLSIWKMRMLFVIFSLRDSLQTGDFMCSKSSTNEL